MNKHAVRMVSVLARMLSVLALVTVLALLAGSTASVAWAEELSDLKLDAESGDAEALYKLGVFYEYGIEVERNSAKAVEWYRKAAE